MTADYAKARRRIDRIMDAALASVCAIAETLIQQAMVDFSSRLGTHCTLHYHDSMGTRGFYIDRPEEPRFWIGGTDVAWYSHTRYGDRRLDAWVQPLVDVLRFLDDLESQYRVTFSEHTVTGTRWRGGRR